MQLYSKEQLNEIPWSKTVNGDRARSFLVPLMENGSRSAVRNADTEFFALLFGDKVLPVCLSSELRDNCYLCSPIQHYIDYALYELSLLKSPIAELILNAVLRTAKKYFQFCRLNSVVYVNNWLVSTNLYETVTKDEYREILLEMNRRFPGRTVLFRSLNDLTNRDDRRVLEELGCRSVVSRQVYITDMRAEEYLRRRDYRRDTALLNRSGYRTADVSELKESDYSRLEELYNQLYLEKYSTLNPHYTAEFLRHAAETGILTVKVLKKGDTIDGVIGWFKQNGVLTCPVLGYDLSVPASEGLYRMLMLMTLQDGKACGVSWINQSSGAAGFKKSRGSRAALEYMVYSTKECGIRQRAGWGTLRILINALVRALVSRYEL